MTRPFSRGHSLAAILMLLASFLISSCADDPLESHATVTAVDARASTEPHPEEAPYPKWALPSDDDGVPGDPMKIVETQRARLHEFAELTEQALKLRPSECDTEMRHEVESEMIPLTIYLPEQPFDFRRYRNAIDEKSRTTLKEERQSQLRPHQEPIAQQIEDFGGLVTNFEYVLNALDADVPICELTKLSELSNIVGMEHESSQPIPNYVDGIQRRAALGLSAGGHPVFTGSIGSTRNASNRVRYGVIESDNNLNTSHSSFKAGASGTRIVDTDRCAFWFPSYRCINSASGTVSTHGTAVTSVILSDYTLGQSPNVTGTTERRRRSGIAPSASVHYYSAKNWRTIRSGVKEASLEDGVDIINMSIGSSDPSNWCVSSTLSGTREAYEAALDAGVISVVSAGNSGEEPDTCTVNATATYPTTISIGGTAQATNLSQLELVSRDKSSSYGTRDIVLLGGRKVPTQLIDLVTNYCHTRLAGSNSDETSTWCGTSFSAPAIAGIAGLVKHWIAYRGGLPQSMASDPIAIRTILSLMGDGRGASLDSLGARDREFGHGNLRFVNLDEELGASGSWGIHRAAVSTGTIHEWNIGNVGLESSNLKGFKAVAIADRNSYSESPDINFQLIDKCASSGEFAVLTATRSALQWRIRAWRTITPYLLHNRCLWLRATTDSAVNATNLYVAWVLYSNDRIYHDASNQ